MIQEGAQAPTFELPGIRGGELVEIDASEVFGGGIVVVAFYPGDFNPACSGTETDLDELDLFTMQKDVAVLAISGDSVHSHRAFAEEFSLEMTLLSDLRGEVARQYGVAVGEDSAGHLTKRAVFVVDHTGTVQYAWATDDLEDLPDVDEIRDTVQGIGDDDTAHSRYRVGHARYVEGRRAFTSAMNAYEDREWMMAQTDFAQAAEEFDEALEEFNTAVRFSESEEGGIYFERAEEKAEALWRASEWLSESAGAFASGSGRKAESLRSDAEGPLETVRELHEPPDPDDFPPEEDPAELDEADKDGQSWLQDDEDIDTSLDADIDAELDAEAADDEAADLDETTNAGPEAAETADAGVAGADGNEEPVEAGEHADPADEDTDDEGDDGAAIDDAELEEITAELEEQTEAAQDADEETEPEPGGGNVVPQDLNGVEEAPEEEALADGASADGEGATASDVDGGSGEDGGADDEERAGGEGPAETADEAETPATEADDRAADAESDEGANDGEEDIELDLTDPTEGEDEDEDEDDEEDTVSDEALGESGDHGVPDSL